MNGRAVLFSNRAIGHLRRLYAWIETASGVDRAEDVVGKVVAFCETLTLFPDRGTLRDDLRPGLRIIGFRRLVSIAIMVEADAVVVLGIYYRGRDYESELRHAKDE